MEDLSSKGKLVDVEKLKLRVPQREVTQQWIHLFKGIPPGKAFVTTAKALGVGSPVTVRTRVDDYRKKGWVPKELRVSLRMRRDGDYDIYIIHQLPKEKEASD